jgi:uridine kinase
VHRDGRPEHFEALLVARIERLRGRFAPLVVALDGRSGSGKSTLATAVAARIGAVVIDGDDFYGGGSAEAWDAMTPAERADRCIDWRRQRPVLEALGHGRPASWRAYDWGADNGRLVERSTLGVPATLVILEGVDSARPELADLVDLTVLLDIPDSVRTARIAQRAREHFEPEWAERWASAEAWYFGKVMPPSAFDLRRSQNGSVSWAGAPREVSTTSPLLAGGSVAEPRGRGRPPDVLNLWRPTTCLARAHREFGRVEHRVSAAAVTCPSCLEKGPSVLRSAPCLDPPRRPPLKGPCPAAGRRCRGTWHCRTRRLRLRVRA